MSFGGVLRVGQHAQIVSVHTLYLKNELQHAYKPRGMFILRHRMLVEQALLLKLGDSVKRGLREKVQLHLF